MRNWHDIYVILWGMIYVVVSAHYTIFALTVAQKRTEAKRMKRNEVIDELIKLRQRCARLKCAPNGKTEEWARSEDALGFAINALRHMQYGEWIFHPDGKVKNWGEIVCSKCGMPIAFGGEWALQKVREKNHLCPSCGAEMEADET